MAHPEVSKRVARNYGLFDQPRSKGVLTALSGKKPSEFYDVGGNGDCGFRAIAAAIIDRAFDNELSETLIAKLLKNFFRIDEFNNKYRQYAWGTTAKERMRHLTEARMRDLVPDMAYALRQMAVDEICRDPATYRGAFVQKHEETSPEHMRKPTTWIDESCIAALATELDLPITVQYVEPNRDIYKPFYYNEEAKSENPEIVIQLQSGHYIPKLVHGERFSTVRSQPINAVKPTYQPNDRPMEEILKVIEDEDKRIKAMFDDTKKRLKAHVADGSADDKEFLINLYIQNMSFKGDDYLSGRIAHICNERNNNDFRDAINNARQGNRVALFDAKRDEPIIEDLVHAIARAITIGQINGADVFEQIEQRSSYSLLSM